MILRDAVRVLVSNWDGSYTVPSRRLYPHQWSWDSAFIAIGNARWSPRRARTELLSLFGAQWLDGRVPHIVFNPRVPEDAYFPSAEFWRAAAPSGARTSGIVQPPVHALAAWKTHQAEPDPAFLRRIYPRLVAQQEFLRAQRRSAEGLISIVHPWESGMDNSPAWDLPLAAVQASATGFVRRDLQTVSADERPTDRDYVQYVELAQAYRESGYREPGAFHVEDPLFNTAYGVAESTLAAIAEVLGLDPEPHRREAEAITGAMVRHLFDGKLFQPRDVHSGALIDSGSVAGLTPLMLPGLPAEVADALIGTAISRFGLNDMPLPSYALDAPEFDPARYWRGPSWVNVSWLVWQGLRERRPDLARTLADAMMRSVSQSGFREYFNPLTLRGHGCRDFSWSAALILDIVAEHSLNGLKPSRRESGQESWRVRKADDISDHVLA
ncbi:glycogen debranching enzyme [Nonomuraea thailandensis]|uniref:Glycogen debranching enzyme n=1 Tax=Nonomuraea thailandensis TaxID=1188745 RepID=A0A9X2GPA6_9ACTN|nr:glycogen debranching enzyme [Nonomuraea thailandensis]